MPSGFYPSRWRRPAQVVGVVLILLAPARLLLIEGRLAWLAVLSTALAGATTLRRARALGVSVTNAGVRVQSLTPFGGAGTWSWDELQSVHLFHDAAVKNGPEQLGLRATSGELIRLGPSKGQEQLIEALRARLTSTS